MEIGRYWYEIDEENILRIWETYRKENGEPPFLYQPVHPDGRGWESAEEADAWAKYIINEWEPKDN